MNQCKTALFRSRNLKDLAFFRGFAKGWFPKGWFRRMFPRNEKPERGYGRQNHPFGNRPFISQCPFSGVRKRVVSKRVVSADVPPERKPERGYVRQTTLLRNRPFISQWFLSLDKNSGKFGVLSVRKIARKRSTFDEFSFCNFFLPQKWGSPVFLCFGCALTLRAQILKKIREERGPKRQSNNSDFGTPLI